MTRLIVPGHEGRVFRNVKAEEGAPPLTGFLSLGDSDPTQPRHDYWAVAVVLGEEPRTAEQHLFEEIVHLREPFVAAEVVRVGGAPVAVGFLLPEAEEDSPPGGG